MKTPDETSHGIALKFAETFQHNYPDKKPLWVMMEELRSAIEQHSASQLSDYKERLKLEIEKRFDDNDDFGNYPKNIILPLIDNL